MIWFPKSKPFQIELQIFIWCLFLTNSTVNPTIYRSRMMVHIRVKCINKCLYTRISRAELLCLCPDKSVSFFVPWVLGQLCASEMLSVYVKIFTNKIISLCQVFPHVLQQKQNPLSKKYNTRFVMLDGWIRKQKSKCSVINKHYISMLVYLSIVSSLVSSCLYIYLLLYQVYIHYITITAHLIILDSLCIHFKCIFFSFQWPP